MSAALTREARQFLFATRHAVLSTYSMKYPGYPFGAIAPFICNQQAEPVILVNASAEHAKNVHENAKVSLLVFSETENRQAQLTLIGEALPCEKNDADFRARYLRYFPDAVTYYDLDEFHLYRVRVEHVRYIAGLGRVDWFEGDSLNEDLSDSMLAAQEAGIVSHMNDDHIDSMLEYCQHIHGITADQAEMIGLDAEGFDVKYTQGEEIYGQLRFQFEKPVLNAMDARKALVALAQACRS
ncbi:HugZ family protein [Methylophilus flavus]|uniref:HugZ family protein n=1 Tax=Methylophilus flavus TaxID=640084 RepID=A0ABW3PGY1_9PROT